MLSRILRWWRLRRTHRDDIHLDLVVILLPRTARTADDGSGDADSDACDQRSADELDVRAALLAALGETPGGDR
ncbi:hypothetical protein [Streptomyces sp. NBC_00038]|uniref:hypothetical protein n=1 Tax=Streptomyces sp. NBC_00038 TaxID=2903615 RepID=UPI00224FAACE|nr:hypothetical protein [Streptomyces sp. NBC_00038]MCX5561099.1 hypothetical protein [Streptomyces sp. NBC_00038]